MVIFKLIENLKREEFTMDILRFITAGSVDDGKSTLIGRLLYDSKSILIDQLEAIEKQTKNRWFIVRKITVYTDYFIKT